MSVKLEISSVMDKHFAAACSDYAAGVVERLALKHNFDALAALKELGIVQVQRQGVKKRESKSERLVPSIPLPYCGNGPEDWCTAIRLNHNLFTQCTMLKVVEGSYCKTCQNQYTKNGSPTYGTIEARGVKNWTSPKGKSVINYGNVMDKLNITRDQAIVEAAKFGWEISEEQFVVCKAKKGRPSKKSSTSDTESEKSEKKPRGRPRKQKKVVSNSAAGDDLIKTLIAAAAAGHEEAVPVRNHSVEEPVSAEEPAAAEEVTLEKAEAEAKKAARNEKAREKRAAAKAVEEKNNEQKISVAMSTTPAPKPEKFADVFGEDDDAELKVSPLNSDESDAESEAETEVVKFEFDGKTYLKDGDDCLYDMETQDHVGNFDPETKTITLCEDE